MLTISLVELVWVVYVMNIIMLKIVVPSFKSASRYASTCVNRFLHRNSGKSEGGKKNNNNKILNKDQNPIDSRDVFDQYMEKENMRRDNNITLTVQEVLKNVTIAVFGLSGH